MPPKAPPAGASKNEHKKHADEFLAREEHKKEPKDRRVHTDVAKP